VTGQRNFSDRSEDFSDRSLVDYRVECCDDCRPQFYILPVKGSDLYKICEERGLLDRGRLHAYKYRWQLSYLLSSAISGVCSELGLTFGGCNKPLFGGFEVNGPAWTLVVDGVSVDITPAFKAPKDIVDEQGRRIMEEIAEKVSSRVSSTMSSRVSSAVSSMVSFPVNHEDRPDYVNLGLLGWQAVTTVS